MPGRLPGLLRRTQVCGVPVDESLMAERVAVDVDQPDRRFVALLHLAANTPFLAGEELLVTHILHEPGRQGVPLLHHPVALVQRMRPRRHQLVQRDDPGFLGRDEVALAVQQHIPPGLLGPVHRDRGFGCLGLPGSVLQSRIKRAQLFVQALELAAQIQDLHLALECFPSGGEAAAKAPRRDRVARQGKQGLHRRRLLGADTQHAEPVRMVELEGGIPLRQFAPETPHAEFAFAHIGVVEHDHGTG